MGPSPEAARQRQPEPRPRHSPNNAGRRSRGRTTAIVAAFAVAAVLGGAGAIWAGYDGDHSSVRESKQPTTRPQSATPRTTTTSSAPRTPFRPPGRPPAFHVPGAPKEPLGEITLPARARRLEAWLTPSRTLTTATLHHWLYQHAWIVTGARFGWWHGAEAIRTLIRVDRRVEARWGIGHRSEAAARRALAEVEAKAK